MERKYIKSLLNQTLVLSQRCKLAGFTLIELLITLIMASIVLSSLLSLVVQLLQSDRQEAIRNETQRDMQMALNYIRQDIREAVYIYDGDCLRGRQDDPATTQVNEFCPGVVNHIGTNPNNPSNSIPILAFWRLEPLPLECRIITNQTPNLCGPFLLAGRTYSLVVYFLARNQSDPLWQGQARIERYELAQFNTQNNIFQTTQNYISPIDNRTSFRTWPQNNATGVSLQTARPPNQDPTNKNTLVDFIDIGGGGLDNPCPPNDYIVSPNTTTLTANGFAGIRSFYACVRVANAVDQQNQAIGLNQDAIVFLRGNAKNRRGYDGSSLATLQTQVLGRGVVDKQPAQ